MSTITKERVAQFIKNPLDNGLTRGEQMELARIALASLEAEPVAFRAKLQPPSAIGSEQWDYTDHRQPDAFELENCSIECLYTAPPAPSVDEGLLHMAASAIDDLLSKKDRSGAGVWADIPAKLRRSAMLHGADGKSTVVPDCWCRTCRPVKLNAMRFVVCPECGNKRCPHANDHRNACTGSNDPGQEGSAYPAAPQHEGVNQQRSEIHEEMKRGARLTNHRFKV